MLYSRPSGWSETGVVNIMLQKKIFDISLYSLCIDCKIIDNQQWQRDAVKSRGRKLITGSTRRKFE